jgi:hypothetical protein
VTGNTWRIDLEKIDAVHKMSASIGYALWQCQALENTLVHYIVLKYRVQRGVSPVEAETAFNSVRRLTLGNLLADIRNQPDAPAPLVRRLVGLLKERNWLAHKCFSENQGVIHSTKRLAALMDRCEGMANEALSLNKEFASLLEAAVLANGVRKEEIDSQATKLIASWIEE